MMVLFADIDGVFRHEDFFKNNIFESTADHTDGLFKFDGRSMKNLNHIVEETGAKVVDLSGDYRYRDREVYEKWYGIGKEKKPVNFLGKKGV